MPCDMGCYLSINILWSLSNCMHHTSHQPTSSADFLTSSICKKRRSTCTAKRVRTKVEGWARVDQTEQKKTELRRADETREWTDIIGVTSRQWIGIRNLWASLYLVEFPNFQVGLVKLSRTKLNKIFGQVNLLICPFFLSQEERPKII